MPLKWMFLGAITLAALSGCASAPPRMVQDLRPEGNAGLRLQDASPDRWIFSTGTDQMTGQRGYSAATWSKTVINLPYPYQGEQRASLMVGVNAGGYVYAVVGIPKGQVSCIPSDGCDLRVKFNNSSVESYSAHTMNFDNSMLFIYGASRFIEKLKAADSVLIELPIFDAPSALLEFKTDNLPWAPRNTHAVSQPPTASPTASPPPTVAPAPSSPQPAAYGKSKEQRLEELRSQTLPYEEYQRRYQQIMSEP